MLELRLASLETYHSMAMPKWGPSLYELNMDEIVTYVRPKASAKASWEDVPREIKETFERLGIPEAERKSLAGVGAQYDSEVVYHSIKEELTKQGVVYLDMETAVREHESLVREYFMQLLPATSHKFLPYTEPCGLAARLSMCRKVWMLRFLCNPISALTPPAPDSLSIP